MAAHRKPKGEHMAGRPKDQKLLNFNATIDEIAVIDKAVEISGMTKTNLLKRAALKAAREIIDADAKARGSLPQTLTQAA